MNKKIVGVTVGTPIRPESMRSKMQAVKSVNGVAPDDDGNVDVIVGSGVDVVYDEDTCSVKLVSTPGTETGGAGGVGGVGIASIAFKEKTEDGNVYTITLTDGSQYEFTAPEGAPGEKGEQGEKGDTGAQGEPGENGVGIASIAFKEKTDAGNVYSITLTDERTYVGFIAVH